MSNFINTQNNKKLFKINYYKTKITQSFRANNKIFLIIFLTIPSLMEIP